MNDVVGKAVLRALGSSLEWVPASLGHGLDSQILYKSGLRCWYYINIPAKDAVQNPVFHLRLKYSFAPNVYGGYRLTLDDAKAVCERHYDTGAWEM